MKHGITAAALAACMAAVFVFAEDGEYTQNSMPGTNTVWTAERTRREIAEKVCTDEVARASAAYAYSPTNIPPALTNLLLGATFSNGQYWAKIVLP